MKQSQSMARSESGFTLVELLVVILIIAILASIALPSFLGQTQKAQDADAKSNVSNAHRSLLTAKASSANQDWSDSSTGTSADVSDFLTGEGFSAHPDTAIPAVKEIGVDRRSDTEVVLSTHSDSGRFYCITAFSMGLTMRGVGNTLSDCKDASAVDVGWDIGSTQTAGECNPSNTATDEETKDMARDGRDIVLAVATNASYPYEFNDASYDSIPEINALLQAELGVNVTTVNQLPDFGAVSPSDYPNGPNNFGMVFFRDSDTGRAEIISVVVSPSSKSVFLYSTQGIGFAIPCDADGPEDFFDWS